MDEVKYLGYMIGDWYEINFFFIGVIVVGECVEFCVDFKIGWLVLVDWFWYIGYYF